MAVAGGGKFANGARTAAYLQAFGEAADHYQKLTRARAYAGPGKDPPPVQIGDDESERFTYTPEDGTGQIPLDRVDTRVWGIQAPLTGNFFEDFFKQGGFLSGIANRIPGQHALSVYHDTVVNKAGISMGAYYNRWIVNFSTIPHSILISYGAVLGNATQGWVNSPGYFLHLTRPRN